MRGGWIQCKLPQDINLLLFSFLQPLGGMGHGKRTIRQTDLEAMQHVNQSLKFLSHNYGRCVALKQNLTSFLTCTKVSCQTLIKLL